MIEFTVIGEARPAGALAIGKAKDGRTFLRPGRGAGPLGEWKRAIKDKAGEHATGPPTRQAVAVQVRFYFPRPTAHFGTGRNAGVLKDSAAAYPKTRSRGDVDKLARATLDALTGVLFADDSQVVDLDVGKRYADDGPARAEIRVRPMQELDVLFELANKREET